MAHWILKTEPGEYSFDRLRREGRTVWDGVSGNLALLHFRRVRRGDPVLVYHTGKEKAAVGLARFASDPYPDPGEKDPRRLVADLEPEAPLPRPIPLEEFKSHPLLRRTDLVRIPRLSVVPLTETQWRATLSLAKRRPAAR